MSYTVFPSGLTHTNPRRPGFIESAPLSYRMCDESIVARRIVGMHNEVGQNGEGLRPFAGLELVPDDHEEQTAPNLGRESQNGLVDVELFRNAVSAGDDEVVLALLESQHLLLSRF